MKVDGSHRVLVAMSGGVDSSTVAALLKRQGHDVIGAGFSVPNLQDTPAEVRACRGGQGLEDARRVADRLSIPFHVLNYEDRFERDVIAPFCAAYLAGLTPNPCVTCNRLVKFGHLLQLATTLGADKMATGHYARIGQHPTTGRWMLQRGANRTKDQAYFLHALTQDQLAQALFPLGAMTKEETRQLARDLALPVSAKPASQDICFLGRGDYRVLLAKRYPGLFHPGPIVNRQGHELGTHTGIANYTVGQRKGLRFAAGHPLHVLAIDAQTNCVIVGTREELKEARMSVRSINWPAFDTPPARLEATVKIRYRHADVAAIVSPTGPATATVTLAEPQVGVAPGQSAVFYDGETVLGGGIIDPPDWLGARHKSHP